MEARQKLGRFYKSSSGDKWLSSANVTDINTSRMSASAIVTTPAFDREKDSLNPLGATTSNYKSNPIWLWNHGFDETLPVGISESPEGKLELHATKSGMRATCYFSKSLQLASQIFGLVDEKIIRATSVRFTPNERPQKHAKGLYYDSWDLEEISWCPIGVNPEAVRGVMAKGLLDGSRIHQSIVKSFQPYLPGKRAGVVLKGTRRDFVGGWGEIQEGNPMDSTPYGARVLMATHCSVKGLMRNLTKSQGALEHPRVGDTIESVLKALEEMETRLKGVYGEEYADDEDCECPEGEECNCDKGEEEEGKDKPVEKDEVDSEEYKSFLQQSDLKRFETASTAKRLQVMSGDENLTSIQKGILTEAASSIRDAVKGSRVVGKKEAIDPVMKSRIKEAQDALEAAKAKLDSAKPAKKV